MNRAERNERICHLYREGWTQGDLANRFHLSTPRIGQILAQAGLVPADRPRLSTVRTELTSVLLTQPTKDAVRTSAKTEEKSLSAWIAEAVDDALKQRGIVVHAPILDAVVLPRLPFEGTE